MRCIVVHTFVLVGLVLPASTEAQVHRAPSAQLVSEAWFRIGEQHFDDYANPRALDLAIAAYARVLTRPDNRLYDLALYKTAWAHYRASRYAEAIRYFTMLLQWSDEQQRVGDRGSQLRAEAVQYVAIAFAHDDWNENGIADAAEGLPDPVSNLRDPVLLPQDRAWTPEIYVELGQVFFDEAKYPEAVRVWRLALARWPRNRAAPQIMNRIAQAHHRNNDFNRAAEVRSELANLVTGEWSLHQRDPVVLRDAELLAENALLETAIHEHQTAQRMRRHAVEAAGANASGALQHFESAKRHYGLAVRAYEEYLTRYPNNLHAYELRYNLADALYWSESYERAAREYARVRDSNYDDVYRSEAARRVVESRHRVLERAVDSGALQVRTEPPRAAPTTPPSVRPIRMPDLVEQLADAREAYVTRVSESGDRESVRAAYEYNNALLLHTYGFWPQARERLHRIFDQRCSGERADETGEVAWELLLSMAETLRDTDEAQRLSAELTERRCSFGRRQPCAVGEQLVAFCERTPGSACCVHDHVEVLRHRRALEVLMDAQRASGPERARLYERAAAMFIDSVNRAPAHPDAPLALERAGQALEHADQPHAARRVYQRIVDEVGPRRHDDPERQNQFDRIVAHAYFRAAFTANRSFDLEGAIRSYRQLVDSPRFRESNDERIQSFRRDALNNSSLIYERKLQYAAALRGYRQLARAGSPELAQLARFRIGEVAYRRGDWRLVASAMRSYVDRYESDAHRRELVVFALSRLAEANGALGRQRPRIGALRQLVSVYSASDQSDSRVAERAARAMYELAEEGRAGLASWSISVGRPRSLEQYVTSLARQVDAGAARAARSVERYARIPNVGRVHWTIAALVRQGQLYEGLAEAVLDAPVPFVLPAAMRGRRLSASARATVQADVQNTVRAVLDTKARPIECLAIQRYALAARAGRAGSLDTELVRTAIERLTSFGDERTGECIESGRATDPSIAAHRPGEFERAPHGLRLPSELGVPMPSLQD